MSKNFLKRLLLWFAIVGCGMVPVLAQRAASEYEVKAAFVYNFVKFVEWPAKAFAGKESPYVIGVLGTDPFFDANALVNYLDQAVVGKSINERKLEVRKMDRAGYLNLKECHLLFVCKSERSRLKDILFSIRGNPVLTLSEIDGFCQQGGVINFISKNGKVRFEINPGAADLAGLKISSKLLNVAEIVPTQPR